MKIRTRLTLWYAGMLLGSLLLMGGVLHYELVGEAERGMAPETPAEKIEDLLLFYGLPTVLTVVLGGFWLIRRTLRPIELLTAAAERVHAGNLEETIPLSGRGDELDRLATVFNEMLARVGKGIETVRDFTLRASHELKTPLTILSAETEIALGDAENSPAQHGRLVSQFEEIRRLAALVDALALLAKADAGLPVVVREKIDLGEMLRAAMEDAGHLAAARAVTVELGTCDPAVLRGDRDSVRQMLLNLLDNAVKHNHPGGWVRAKLELCREGCFLTVENSGPVIPDQLVPLMFERFVRGRDGGEGSGLGLSIARALVEMHEGTIACVPRTEGGACFTIRLPAP
ncbi:MAG: integral rane sensor signal transduction histidine kinase [Verrucomicrobiales bacterium]|nr:integral rane sensor signal transduction histidine kinase [Verrucomicrobiales bacterium]